MSWFNIWDGLKNKTCRYLLQRYLGQFLQDQLNLEQLNIDLYNGKAIVKDVSLKAEAINDLFETQGWDFEVISGHIGLLTVIVPWNALMITDSSIEITDLFITLRPIKREHDDSTSMLESMWSSFTSSMQMAEECMKQNDETTTENTQTPIVGLEKFAETIDNVLNRIKAKLKNTCIRLEYPSADNTTGISVVINIDDLIYKNETGCEIYFKKCPDNDESNYSEYVRNYDDPSTNTKNSKTQTLPIFAKHHINLNGLKLSTEEFKISEDEDVDYEEYDDIESSNKRCCAFLEIKGQQQIIMKIKQAEEIIGPKVRLDIELGDIYTFLTPRQVQLLIKFSEAFDEEKKSIQLSQKKSCTDHLDDAHSKERFDIDKPLHSQMTGILSNEGNWADEHEIATNKFYNHAVNQTHHAAHSFRYCDSLSSSMSSSTTITGISKFQRKTANLDACGEILNFCAKIKSFIILLLHEDILFESSINIGDTPLNEKSLLDMRFASHNFFKNLPNRLSDDELNFENCLCEKSHLYFRMSPLFIDGTQHRNRKILQSNVSISATTFDLYEKLEDVIIPILQFEKQEMDTESYHKRSQFILTFKSTSTCNYKEHVVSTCDITLEKSTLEFDITMIDRLSGILGPSPFITDDRQEIENVPKKKSDKNKSEIRLNLSQLDVKLRFPIVDLRPIHELERVPWWKQNIRDDFLFLSFYQMIMKFYPESIDISANEIDVFYCENLKAKEHILKTYLCKIDSPAKEPVYEYPKINISFPAYQNLLYNFAEDLNLPFSSKRSCRQSSTVHSQSDADCHETDLYPGDREEMAAFRENTVKSSKLQVKISLPQVELLLESKHMYEIIYNRLNSDIFMWEPSAPIFKSGSSKQESDPFQSPLDNANLMDSVYAPSPSTQVQSGSVLGNKMKNLIDAKLYGAANEASFISNNTSNFSCLYESTTSLYASSHENIKSCTVKSNACSIDISIGKGAVSLFVPVRDADGLVMPGQCGKFDIRVSKLRIFSVNGYKKNKNLGFLCLELNDLEIYHCGIVPLNALITLPNLEAEIDNFMRSALYKTRDSLTKSKKKGCPKRNMLSLVIEIKKIPNKKIKRLRITTGMQTATLRYNSIYPPKTWIKQIIDFFDVMDYPIRGYTPSGVISEIQLHFWDCAVDYRPKNLPFRAVIEFGMFTLSSNIISSVSSCNLRFIVEEGFISIAPFDNNAIIEESAKITELDSKALVPVLEIGLLDISIRMTNTLINTSPKFDLRCSIYDAHLRTCYDSASAFARLIIHIANDDDTNEPKDDEKSSISFHSSSTKSDAESLFNNDRIKNAEKLRKQQEHVSQMMADAVQEIVTPPPHNRREVKRQLNPGYEVFYFPDESNKMSQNSEIFESEADEILERNEMCDIYNYESSVMSTSYYVKREDDDTLPQIKEDLGLVPNKGRFQRTQMLRHEEDYCVIAEEEKPIVNAMKTVKLSDDPLRIVDNHFCLPSVKMDMLHAPDDFPMSVNRYTLCEMTFTWHMYGGKDFPECLSRNDDKHKKSKSDMSETYRKGVSYSKSSSQCNQAKKKSKDRITWKTVGGPERNQEVLVEMQFTKVRFSHEIYPAHTSQASRQVLLITDFEIRDLLQTSEIKKFLYHPRPKTNLQKNTQHMIVIKALHVRPSPQISPAQECSLRISLLPMRLHIDQDTLLFLADFFTSLSDNCSTKQQQNNSDKSTTVQGHAPILSVEDLPESLQDLQARQMVTTNLDLLMDDDKLEKGTTTSTTVTDEAAAQLPAEMDLVEDSSPVYFREVIFSPEVSIKFDYHGRRFELSRGPVAGLLMGLGQLQCSEIRLKKILYRRGLLGVDKLINFLCKEWLRDIKRNQLSKILSGVGPTKAIVQLFQGIFDLFWLPIEQYQKDGRIIRGLQLGAQSFTARTALAALEITSRIIQILQFTAETTFDMVSPGPSVRRTRQKGKKKRPHRPRDMMEGVTNAYVIVKEGINDSANALIETAVAEHDQKGYTGAVGAVMRQIPQLMVCPAVLATQATTNFLGGVKSSLVPEAKMEACEKWKDDTD